MNPSATAFVHRDSLFLAQYLTRWNEGGSAMGASHQHAWLRSLYASLHPYASGQAYQNYADPDLTNWQQAYYGANYARLSRSRPHMIRIRYSASRRESPRLREREPPPAIAAGPRPRLLAGTDPPFPQARPELTTTQPVNPPQRQDLDPTVSRPPRREARGNRELHAGQHARFTYEDPGFLQDG